MKGDLAFKFNKTLLVIKEQQKKTWQEDGADLIKLCL